MKKNILFIVLLIATSNCIPLNNSDSTTRNTMGLIEHGNQSTEINEYVSHNISSRMEFDDDVEWIPSTQPKLQENQKQTPPIPKLIDAVFTVSFLCYAHNTKIFLNILRSICLFEQLLDSNKCSRKCERFTASAFRWKDKLMILLLFQDYIY